MFMILQKKTKTRKRWQGKTDRMCTNLVSEFPFHRSTTFFSVLHYQFHSLLYLIFFLILTSGYLKLNSKVSCNFFNILHNIRAFTDFIRLICLHWQCSKPAKSPMCSLTLEEKSGVYFTFTKWNMTISIKHLEFKNALHKDPGKFL